MLTRTQLLSTDHDWTEVMLTGFDLSGVDFAAGGFTLARALPSVRCGTVVLCANSTFDDVNLTAANFAGMDLTGVQFAGSVLADVDFTGVDLTGGLISMVGGTVHPAAQSDTTFAGARLRAADLTGLAIDPHMLLEADRDWSGTTFHGTQRPYVSSSGFLPSVSYYALELADVDWAGGGWDLTDASFTGSGNTQFNLANGNFAGMDLTGWRCKCDLTSADFTGANLFTASLQQSKMTGATVAGAGLVGANLLSVTGNPAGGSTAIHWWTVCPDGSNASIGSPQPTCAGHGLGP